MFEYNSVSGRERSFFYPEDDLNSFDRTQRMYVKDKFVIHVFRVLRRLACTKSLLGHYEKF